MQRSPGNFRPAWLFLYTPKHRGMVLSEVRSQVSRCEQAVCCAFKLQFCNDEVHASFSL
jgi:hypothetical protein